MAIYTLAIYHNYGYGEISSAGNQQDAWNLEYNDSAQTRSDNFQIRYLTASRGSPHYDAVADISRQALFFNTDGCPTVVSAGIWAYIGIGGWTDGGLEHLQDTLNVILAPDLNSNETPTDYGYLRTCTTIAGNIVVGPGVWSKYRWVELNADGRGAINPSGLTRFGLRAGRDIANTFPGNNKTWDTTFVFWPSGYTAYLYINELPPSGGYEWVEGSKFAYLDGYRDKRLKEGSLTGVSGKTPGHSSVDGVYKIYVDGMGAVRRIEGTLTGLTGKLPSQISINLAQGGTKYCYIDSAGAERCFEGT